MSAAKPVDCGTAADGKHTMQVQVKLMGMLKSRTPASGRLEIPDGATVADALEALEIPPTHVQVVMVNGRHQQDRGRTLAADDELMIMPPVGGG
jgi:sulfur carrier protein ThiS